MLLRFTPIGVDAVLEDVQRMYVQERLSQVKVKNKHEGNEPVTKEYDVLVVGATCISDSHEAHQGPGLALATCAQCAAMFAKRPAHIDSSFIDNVVRLGRLTYESLSNPNRSSIVSLRPLLEEHEHLRSSLKILYEDHHLCPKRATEDGKDMHSSKTSNANYQDSKSADDHHNSNKSDMLHLNEGDKEENDKEDQEQEDGNSEEVFDEVTNRLIEGHIIQASSVLEYLNKLHDHAHTSTTTVHARRDSSIRFGTALSKAIANDGTSEQKGSNSTRFQATESNGRGGRRNNGNAKLKAMGATTVYMGIICSEQLSLTVAVVKSKTANEDDYLVFDPVKRDGKTDGSHTSTVETSGASVSQFDRISQVAAFISRRLANLDVTQFTFFILSNADSVSSRVLMATAGGVHVPFASADSKSDEKVSSAVGNVQRKQQGVAQSKLKLHEDLMRSRRTSVFSNITVDERAAQSLSVLQAVKHWRTLYLSLIQAMWHLPAFRYHFCRSRKIPVNGRPVNCIVAAAWTLLTKFDAVASPVHGCAAPHVHSQQSSRRSHPHPHSYLQFGGNVETATLSSASKDLQAFLYGSNNEVDNDLRNLHQNMDNLDLAHLDPGHVLEYFLQSSHAASTGTKTRQDPRTRCTCYEPPHINGITPKNLSDTEVSGRTISYPEDTQPGRRECVGHSVFHIGTSERRTCRHCGVQDHAGCNTDELYLNFVHRANVERIVQQYGMMSVQGGEENNNNSRSNRSSGRSQPVTLDRVLRRIIDVHWLRACPDKPLCELCMGKVATSTCMTCDTRQVSDEYFHAKNQVMAKFASLKAEGKDTNGGGGSGSSGESGGGSFNTAETDSGLLISTHPHSSELLEHYERNLSERHSVSLCHQCDRHLHRMSTKLGIHRFQGENLPTKDYRGKIVHCSSCQSDNNSSTTTNMRQGGVNAKNGLERMYKTDGPVRTTETFESDTGYRTNNVDKQLYLCERCYDMGLFPPLTRRQQFTEEHENSQFRSLLKKRLMEEYLKDAEQMKFRQEQLLANYSAEIESLRRSREDKIKGREAVGKSKRAAGKLTLDDIEQKMNVLESKRAHQVEHYNQQRSRRQARMKRSVNRKLNAMLKSRRDCMSLTASHVRNKIPRSEKLESSVSPCSIGSSVHVKLHTAPTVFSLALDWPTASPSGPDIQLTMELVAAPLNLAKVFHSIAPTSTSTSGTWDTLIMLFLRATDSRRLLTIINEMIGFTWTKAVPTSFPKRLSGAA
jgi:hypothetical protein